jgi:hypothetical protein
MAGPQISEIKYLGNGDQDFLEVRIPDNYANPENLVMVIYDKADSGSTTAVPAPSDVFNVTADGQEYIDGSGIKHYTFGTSENGTTIFLHAMDAVGLYDSVTGETFGLYSWGPTPYVVSTASGDPFAGEPATQLDNTGQIRNVTSFQLQEDGEYVVSNMPSPGGSFICFTQGTQILTTSGPQPVETLCIGDEVVTKDHGPQRIRWIGSRTFSGLGPTHQNIHPITIKAHAFGPNVPSCDTSLSPNHCILNDHWKAPIYFGQTEVLTAAKSLLTADYAYRDAVPSVAYFHILLDQHSLVLANGMWSESLFLGSECMEMLSPASRAEIWNLFPHLGGCLEGYGKRARQQIKPKEAHLLT